jgi:hypothetical protein
MIRNCVEGLSKIRTHIDETRNSRIIGGPDPWGTVQETRGCRDCLLWHLSHSHLHGSHAGPTQYALGRALL